MARNFQQLPAVAGGKADGGIPVLRMEARLKERSDGAAVEDADGVAAVGVVGDDAAPCERGEVDGDGEIAGDASGGDGGEPGGCARGHGLERGREAGEGLVRHRAIVIHQQPGRLGRAECQLRQGEGGKVEHPHGGLWIGGGGVEEDHGRWRGQRPVVRG